MRMYYVCKNECCRDNGIAVAFNSKKEAKEYCRNNDGTYNNDLFIESKQDDLPKYIKRIRGEMYKDL